MLNKINNVGVRTGLILTLSCLSLCGAKVYKWTDENGQTHFSTQPPPAVMSKAESFNVSGQGSGQHTIDDIVDHLWVAQEQSRVIEFALYPSHYRWAVFTNDNREAVETGAWELLPRQIQLRSKQGGLVRTLVLRKQEEHTIVLQDAETERNIEFHRLDKGSRELTEQEALLSGSWAEIGNNGSLLGKASFDGGTFRRYDVRRGESRYGPANPNFKVAEGNWSVLGDTLILEYFRGSKRLFGKTAKEEQWEITQLDYRNLVLRSSVSNEILRFERKRTR